MKKALKIAIKKYKIQGIVSGALASNYQKQRIDNICNELNLKSIAPLWHIDPEKYLKDLIKNNFKAIITGIAAEGLNKDFLGKKINNDFIEKIKKLPNSVKFKFIRVHETLSFAPFLFLGTLLTVIINNNVLNYVRTLI
ncbi:MAG: hypothetical protein IIA49_10810 [Bacteroidetes bacterium]|nr:hypothetical protein [Bacteroidota bacterium]